MIKMMNLEGRTASLLFCDVCNERIVNAGAAAAVFQRLRAEGQASQVLHVHKGRCHDQADARLDPSSNAPWQELRHHLLYLLHNVGMDAEVIDSAVISGEALSRLG